MKLWAILPFLITATGISEAKPGRRTQHFAGTELDNVDLGIASFQDEMQLFYHRLTEASFMSPTTNDPKTSIPSPVSIYSQNPTKETPAPTTVTSDSTPPSPSRDPTSFTPEPETREPTPDSNSQSPPPSQAPMPSAETPPPDSTFLTSEPQTPEPTPYPSSQSPPPSSAPTNNPPIPTSSPASEPQTPEPTPDPSSQSPPPSSAPTNNPPIPTSSPAVGTMKPTFCEIGSMKFYLFSSLFPSADVELSTYKNDCEICYRPTITVDFENFQKGEVVSDIGYGINVRAVKIVKRLKGTTAIASPMIFDTSNPTGEDLDLGTPNEDFGGPGVGTGGESGSPLENSAALGKVLIISEDEDSMEPDDSKFGGTLFFTFSSVQHVQSIGLLDNDENAVTFELFKQDNTTEEIFVFEGGDNSYQDVSIDRSWLTGMNVHFKGSGAITHVNLKGRQECGPCVFVYKVCGFKNDPECEEFKQQCEELVCSISQEANPGYVCSSEYEPWP